MSDSKGQQIVFFDGICGLCNDFVDVLLKVDRRKKYQFSPLQSEVAMKLLPEEFRQVGDEGAFKSIVFHQNGVNFQKSKAVLLILCGLGGAWNLFWIFRLLPSALLDPLYMMVANHRYKWFGKKDSCRIPTPEERSRFLL